jgi:hypothetical protein
MEENKKAVIIAEAENVEAIRDFFTEWWTVAELNETASKVCATIINLAARHKLSADELEVLDDLIQQHNLMIDLIKPFERKEGEV